MLSLFAILMGACTGENNDVPPSDEILVRLASIHEVDVSIAESYPPQIFVYIWLYLPYTYNRVQTQTQEWCHMVGKDRYWIVDN